MNAFLKGKFIRNWIPFMLLVIGGSFFVREFAQIRYKYRKVEMLNVREKLKKEGIVTKEPATLEDEYEKLKELDIDNWKNVRIPRPWDEANNTNS